MISDFYRDGHSSRAALYIAAALCLGTAMIHLWELPGHAQDRPIQSLVLLAAGVLQGLYGVALLRWPVRLVVMLGLGINFAILAFHAVTSGLDSYKGLHGTGTGIAALLFTTATLALLLGTLFGVRRILYSAQILCLLAALVHLSQVAGHLDEWWGYWAFFLTVGFGQILYSLALPGIGERSSLLYAGILGNLAVVALWFVTRTAGIPYARTTSVQSFELRFGMAERVGALNLTATMAEAALICLLGLVLLRRHLANHDAAAAEQSDRQPEPTGSLSALEKRPGQTFDLGKDRAWKR